MAHEELIGIFFEQMGKEGGSCSQGWWGEEEVVIREGVTFALVFYHIRQWWPLYSGTYTRAETFQCLSKGSLLRARGRQWVMSLHILTCLGL